MDFSNIPLLSKLIVFLPLAGFIVAALFGVVFKFGTRFSHIVTVVPMVIAAALSWVVFTKVVGSAEIDKLSVPLLTWINIGTLHVEWALRIDTLSAIMFVVVNTVSALVHIYSIGYMSEDKSQPRFFAYLSLFTFAMLMLVTADNLLQMFFGWEGVGLASYLLIGFWFHKPTANAAAMKAFIVNRVGDFGFALGIFAIYKLFGTIEFDMIFAAAKSMAGQKLSFLGGNFDAMTLICLLLFMGAMGKSAQFLLHTWLPDAMEGPTPVSALIHAATMVTAGIVMVARMSPLFEMAPDAANIVAIIGATTAFFAATIGLVQNDIKRVIAYSTCSQLGYMFAALGVGAYGPAVFHLFTHAFFKALLFLGAGSVIHAMHHEQDIRRMGGLWKKIPITYAMMLIGTLALTGFPMTAGFFSKDAIIEATFASHIPAAGYAFLMTVLAAFMTSFYSWRLVFKTFHGKPYEAHHDAHHGHAKHGHDDHSSHGGHHEPHESPLAMLLPLCVLAGGALFAGYIFVERFVGHDHDLFWQSALVLNDSSKHLLHDMHAVPTWVKATPFVMMIAGFALSFWFYIVNPSLPERLAKSQDMLYQFLLNKWYFDELYDLIFVKPSLWLGRVLWKQGDGAIIDRLGPDGISAQVQKLSQFASRLQSGYLYHYAFAMLIGIAALLTFAISNSSSLGGTH